MHAKGAQKRALINSKETCDSRTHAAGVVGRGFTQPRRHAGNDNESVQEPGLAEAAQARDEHLFPQLEDYRGRAAAGEGALG